MQKWTKERIDSALKILGKHDRFSSRLYDELSARLGFDVTQKALWNALERNGKGAPGRWLADTERGHVGGSADVVSPLPDPVTPGLERILIVPDCHHPYVDRAAWNVMLQAARVWKPDRIVVLGDFGDFDCVSGHRKNANRSQLLETETDACNVALDELDELGATRKYFVFGNHEDRLARHLADHSPQFTNMVRVERLFRLGDRGWEWTPYGKLLQVGKVFYAHDPSGCGAWAHARAGLKVGHPIVHGHTHRAAVAYQGNATGERRVAIMAGWLGNPDAAHYAHDVNKTHDWMHAFGIGYLEPSGVTHIQLIPIVNGRACLEGRIVELCKAEAA